MAFLKDTPTRLLEVKDLKLHFGGISAIFRLSLEINEGEIISVIGPNGAGKTSLINCINGIYRAQEGVIRFMGKNIIAMKPNRIAQMGIGRTFQNIALFRSLTVLDNMLIGQECLLRSGFLSGALYLGKAVKEEVKARDKVEEIIEFLDLQHVRKSLVGSLPYGTQKKVELGRALTTEPKILLADEPASGMNLEETEDMARYLIDINEEMNITIILVEHDMGVVMDLSDRIAVLNFGTKIAEGAPDVIAENPEVIQAYLGET